MVDWITQSIGMSFLTYFDYANAGAMTWMAKGLKNWAGRSWPFGEPSWRPGDHRGAAAEGPRSFPALPL
jgi:hypothetical protein